jgi:hypothetical protein
MSSQRRVKVNASAVARGAEIASGGWRGAVEPVDRSRINEPWRFRFAASISSA